VDCFSGSCGGFSTALLVAILQAGDEPATTGTLVAKFRLGENSDRIYGWRLPRLEKQGYVRQDPQSGRYLLTGKGRILAVITFCLKRIMNLGAGG
jgi:DNA-binding IclR family transcriptional regulator